MRVSELLKGEKVRLTAIKEIDLVTMEEWYQNTEFLRYFDSAPANPKTKEQLFSWLKSAQGANNQFVFAIRPLNTDEIIGYIELDKVIWTHRVATLGVGIATNENRGRGYGTEAIKLILDFAFKELNLHRMQLMVFEYNHSAIAVYEKMGFRKEGTFREFIQRDGRRWDMYLYGLLSNEWQDLRE